MPYYPSNDGFYMQLATVAVLYLYLIVTIQMVVF